MLPLSWLFCAIVRLRRLCYTLGVLLVHRLPVPVIVVGNITVGGSGKTPLVAWLAAHLVRLGHRPGIISRGYGGKAESWPQKVTAESDPDMVGDEPLLLARRTGCPLWVGPDRPEAARRLLEESGCDIIISDDGMQHYPLGRDLEIAVIDGERRFGNGRCLPAGPLRELPGRLVRADLVVVNGSGGEGEWGMELTGDELVGLTDSSRRISLEALRGQAVHALAGIGHPERFFTRLRQHGLDPVTHTFPDHHRFAREEIFPADSLPVLMTEKDAVKCSTFADSRHWYLRVDAQPEAGFIEQLNRLLGELKYG